MASNYTVQQGDHLSSIAKAFGFSDYETIWNDPNNASLRQLRQNPNVLLPGDCVYLPDLATREEPRPTNARHKFVKKGPDLLLRLNLEDQFEKPIANAKCVLTLGSSSKTVTTDVNGQIEQPLLPTVKDGVLIIQNAQTPFNNVQIALKIGSLDPVESVSGQIGRLNNLGYFAGDPNAPDADAFESAVEEFQCDHKLPVDGDCGPGTQAALKESHGC